MTEITRLQKLIEANEARRHRTLEDREEAALWLRNIEKLKVENSVLDIQRQFPNNYLERQDFQDRKKELAQLMQDQAQQALAQQLIQAQVDLLEMTAQLGWALEKVAEPLLEEMKRNPYRDASL